MITVHNAQINGQISDVLVVEPAVFGDMRGYFMETYSKRDFAAVGINAEFVQDNESFTATQGTLRGIHFQNAPSAQAKLVRVAHGAVMDIAVDLRRGSPTYLGWCACELSAENKRMLYIPQGFGHAFLTLTDNVLFIYKADSFYNKASDRTIRYDDPQIDIDWHGLRGTTAPILSDKDANAPLYCNSDCNFIY